MNARLITVGVVTTLIVPMKWDLAYVLAKPVFLETELHEFFKSSTNRAVAKFCWQIESVVRGVMFFRKWKVKVLIPFNLERFMPLCPDRASSMFSGTPLLAHLLIYWENLNIPFIFVFYLITIYEKVLYWFDLLKGGGEIIFFFLVYARRVS